MTDTDETFDENYASSSGCDDAASKKSYKCTEKGCHSSFARPSKLAFHVLKHSGKRPFVCEEPGCGKTYTNNSHLRRHKNLSHAGQVVQSFLCEYNGCGLVLSNKQNLQRHFKRKHNADQKYAFPCTQCSLGFKKHQQLKAHMYVHTGEVPFKCEVEGCLKSFTAITDLTKHKRNHKTYSCEVCGEKFQVWSMLVNHKRSSHKKNKHTCATCNKSFSQPARLKRHEFIHLNKLKRLVYTCPVDDCDRFYHFKRNLRQHLKMLHKKIFDGEFRCDYPGCNMVLKRELYLRRHKLLHQRPDTKKTRTKRRDKGKPKKCMASLLTGTELEPKQHKKVIELSQKPESKISEENSCDKIIKINVKRKKMIIERSIIHDPILKDNVQSKENTITDSPSSNMILEDNAKRKNDSLTTVENKVSRVSKDEEFDEELFRECNNVLKKIQQTVAQLNENVV